MGLFSRKKKKEDSKSLEWINIDSVESLNEAFEGTKEKAGLFFKHSTRCGISRMALSRFEKEWVDNENINLYFVDLLNHRDVSNAIADTTKVVHQSPQAILIKNNDVLYDASHGSISASEIIKLI